MAFEHPNLLLKQARLRSVRPPLLLRLLQLLLRRLKLSLKLRCAGLELADNTVAALDLELVGVRTVPEGGILDAGGGEILGDLARGGKNVVVLRLDEGGPE